MTRVRLSSRWAVEADTCVRIEAGEASVWAVMRRFSQFIAADPYHTRVTDEAGARLDELPARGTALRIGHGIGFTWFDRVGTLVRVVPGRGFAFTDLSRRGRAVGFAHVYAYTLKPVEEHACELRLMVRGRWSARWLPRWAVKMWLWWVMAQAGWLMKAHVAYEVGRA